MKKYFSRLLVALSWLLLVPIAGAQPTSIGYDDIVILYENDVHGAIEGYPLMAAMRDQMLTLTPHVAVVSCGDASLVTSGIFSGSGRRRSSPCDASPRNHYQDRNGDVTVRQRTV